MTTRLFTIGFAGSSAEHFFDRLREADVGLLVDLRRHNTSQLAGYTKGRDLPWLLGQLVGADHRHDVALAPAAEDLRSFREGELTWDQFARAYEDRLQALADEAADGEGLGGTGISADDLAGGVALLCSETTAESCHRRLLADHLVRAARDVGHEVEVVHL